MSVKHPAIFVVATMHLQEMGAEILNDSFVVIGTFTERRYTDKCVVEMYIWHDSDGLTISGP